MVEERRLTNQLCEYWSSLKNEDCLPSQDEIDQDYISDIMPNCFIIKKNHDNAQPYIFSFLGQKAENTYKIIYQCTSTEEIIESIQHCIDEVFISGEPFLNEDEIINNYTEVKFRECFLPLRNSSDEKESHVKLILGAVTHRENS